MVQLPGVKDAPASGQAEHLAGPAGSLTLSSPYCRVNQRVPPLGRLPPATLPLGIWLR